MYVNKAKPPFDMKKSNCHLAKKYGGYDFMTKCLLKQGNLAKANLVLRSPIPRKSWVSWTNIVLFGINFHEGLFAGVTP